MTATERFELQGRSLRAHAARGTLVNAAFLAGVDSLNLVKGFVVAGFLSRADYGVWGILVIALGTLLLLKQIGIGDRYVQQEEPDQELAFQRAFTAELIADAAFGALVVAAVPLVCLVYGDWKLLAPGLVLCLLIPAGILQAPIWVHYRRMAFARQRSP